MTYKNIIISFFMTFVVGIAAWTTISYRPQTSTPTKVAELPDAYMEDVTAVIMDKQGKPSMKISTPKMVHYAENDTTNLSMPQLTLYRKSPQPWLISARYAKASRGIENVNFWENVTVQHAADFNSPATTIKTLTLTVHPNERTAETNALITLIQPNIVVKATGMEANMNTGDIKLLSEARGEYVPNS